LIAASRVAITSTAVMIPSVVENQPSVQLSEVSPAPAIAGTA